MDVNAEQCANANLSIVVNFIVRGNVIDVKEELLNAFSSIDRSEVKYCSSSKVLISLRPWKFVPMDVTSFASS